jgi:hypothetical protein
LVSFYESLPSSPNLSSVSITPNHKIGSGIGGMTHPLNLGIPTSSLGDTSAVTGTGDTTFALILGASACSCLTGSTSVVAVTHTIWPLATVFAPRKANQTNKLNQNKSKYFVKSTKTEHLICNHMAQFEKAKQFLLPLTSVPNAGTGNKLAQLCSPLAAATLLPTSKNWVGFEAKKKAAKSKKTKASGEAQPSTSTNAKQRLKLTEYVLALQLWSALANTKSNTLLMPSSCSMTTITDTKKLVKD